MPDESVGAFHATEGTRKNGLPDRKTGDFDERAQLAVAYSSSSLTLFLGPRQSEISPGPERRRSFHPSHEYAHFCAYPWHGRVAHRCQRRFATSAELFDNSQQCVTLSTHCAY